MSASKHHPFAPGAIELHRREPNRWVRRSLTLLVATAVISVAAGYFVGA